MANKYVLIFPTGIDGEGSTFKQVLTWEEFKNIDFAFYGEREPIEILVIKQ